MIEQHSHPEHSRLREFFIKMIGKDKYFLSRTDLKALGMWQSDSTLYRWERAGRWPRRVMLGGTATVWIADEVYCVLEKWIAERSSRMYAEWD